jgi:hypothetical protein
MNKNEEQLINFEELSESEKIKIANKLGEDAGKIMNTALKEVNDNLKKYGYFMSINLDFHELKQS